MKKNEEIKNENKQNVEKQKRHFDPARGAVRIIALLLSIMMVVAVGATALFYLIYSIKGLI